MRAVPVSMTYRMPGTVRLVSATFVARMTRRRTPATLRALEHPVLLGGAQPAVEGEDLGGRGILRVHAAHGIRRVADLGLAGEEDEHVARGLAVELAQRGDDAVDVVRLAGARLGSAPPEPVGRYRISTG